ncbi:HAMP domain-containing protein [Halomonas sp. MCCC 1A17488]|uniref:HAMP domain-containing protein n=1 Tax=Billgrantia sulfidoxydans TaxID=2733484 RepID=A0ABX7W0K8_9GAMM|nr:MULTISPECIES: methyl-accepting chemotaxis protein [Halomonas]MCE8016439.1 HAMP domain-containing protein [Halomonas sp. MCCC 1A17488]MCG3239772.1 HAMP domain-containing protein [Halomonas sp. MCCC 1A17488]QPP50326.1 cache domain-containing protein [Halomonas sp. SS10-MC5]QTP53944.1 HAMP domain-containing protein [Halomonas sulfidoxydans]
MHASASKASFSLQLQTRLLLLVLLPLLLTTLSLVVIDGYTRAKDSQVNLAHQRELLIETRKAGVRDVVESAHSAIQPILEASTLSDADKRERAAEILRAIRFEGGNYVFAYQHDGLNVVTAPMPEREGTNMIGVQAPDGAYIIRDLIDVARQGGGFYSYPWEYPGSRSIETKYSYAVNVPEFDWMLGAGVYITDIDAAMAEARAQAAAELRQSILTSTLIGLVLFAGVAAVSTWLVRRTVAPIRRTAEAMRDIAKGQGDLTRRLKAESRDEIGELAAQFNAFVSRMQDTLRDVRRSTASVNQAAEEIAQGSDELATRTEQAAANLQETSASMEEITATVNHSTESAEQANQLVVATSQVARDGESAMQRVERTMADIDASSSRIAEIVGLIDGIAFQTNILALNASVEAARAGEHGRGFAVVAQEVRTLASRSGEAAKEIRDLINTSVAHARDGSEIVQRAGATMQEIVTSVARVSDVIAEISAGAREQNAGIGQINTAVAEMDTMTQQNAAMVQQTSTTATEMRRHAQHLSDLVGTFVLGEDGDSQPKQRAAPAALPRPVADPRPRKVPASHVAEEEWETF